MFAGSDPGASRAAGRTITGWIDVSQLPIADQAAETAAEAA